ncbi:hypothetical protein VCUG_01121 [Vavraia culicis subsp. floridensis]|uniref:Uncharacterized protein n=1 Tax=Vavraia culicis (isolate floridensis) TaxID=948595 RepID=L2GVH8_VAVCU|nr:uncharacterized protein VCUG_01121 [Vavraia culicis subsp. floridensis]ELA47352.1 hypothetical protein VCUG_01121 [Vavraia culicis subsp. floridensis]
MFNRYKLKELKRAREDRNNRSKAVKHNVVSTKEEFDKVVHMLSTPHLFLHAYNKILNNGKLLDDNIYKFTILIFSHLLSSKKDKIIVKSIECIKKICGSVNFLAVKEISYDYFKSLFYLNRFPCRLVSCFTKHYGDFAKEYDEEFWSTFREKMKIEKPNKKIILKKNLNENVYLLNSGIE